MIPMSGTKEEHMSSLVSIMGRRTERKKERKKEKE